MKELLIDVVVGLYDEYCNTYVWMNVNGEGVLVARNKDEQCDGHSCCCMFGSQIEWS